MKFYLLGLLLTIRAFANDNDVIHRPKSFPINGSKAVFADFTDATYFITYDIPKKQASVKAEIAFEVAEEGFPIFDSVIAPTLVKIDGETTAAPEVKTPSRETTLRIVNRVVTPGKHRLSVELPLTTLVEFSDDGVKSALWTSDLDEREYLERYLPANFEFDQVKMTFFVKYIGAKKKHMLYTNGLMEAVDSQTVKITYPSYYTASSIFYHTLPQSSVDEVRFTLKSIDGRTIPAVVYTQKSIFGGSVEGMKKRAIETFQELESDYGAFLHPTLIIYQAGMGGMEYCGATMTDQSSVGHEMFHSYFARGVMPANGNSGWLDEALASWRDDGYERITTLSGSTGMSSHPYYTRITDTAAYSFGSRFMSYLDGKFADKGGLKPFLRHMVEKRSLSPLFVEEFMKEMGEFYGMSVEEDFKRYTYGSGDFFSHFKSEKRHRKMSLEELKKYL